MPAGEMFARYLKVSKAADPAWFYLHIACQTSAYIIGVDGWGTGLKLGSKSVGVTNRRTIRSDYIGMSTTMLRASQLLSSASSTFTRVLSFYARMVRRECTQESS
ncbi:hypothetical protein QQ045_007662 [Rhodiola kirilowii]